MNSKLAIRRADIVVTDDDGAPLLLVEVKRRRFDQSSRRQVEASSKAARPDYVMGVDPHHIVTAQVQAGSPDWSNAVTLRTSDILRHYADVGELEQIEGFYLESLVEAWLRDFALGWKSEQPPGYKELDHIGLAKRLRNGEVKTEVEF